MRSQTLSGQEKIDMSDKASKSVVCWHSADARTSVSAQLLLGKDVRFVVPILLMYALIVYDGA